MKEGFTLKESAPFSPFPPFTSICSSLKPKSCSPCSTSKPLRDLLNLTSPGSILISQTIITSGQVSHRNLLKHLYVSLLSSSFPFLHGYSWIFLTFQRICFFVLLTTTIISWLSSLSHQNLGLLPAEANRKSLQGFPTEFRDTARRSGALSHNKKKLNISFGKKNVNKKAPGNIWMKNIPKSNSTK